MAASAGNAGSQSWWTGGRIAVAIVVVLLLMAGAGFAGFLAGVAVGTTNSILDDFEDFEGFDPDLDGEFDIDEVPGVTPLDTEVAEGSPLQPGGRVSGVVGDRPVEHVLDLPDGGDVDLEVTDANFDTVLLVLDASGVVVTSDDDGGQDRLSRITTSLEPGTYTVRVQSWGGNGGGYTLVAR